MISGIVTEDLDLLVTIEVFDGNGVLRSLEAVLDTGFNGDLALPRDVILELGLAYRGKLSWILATGQEETMSNYDGAVSWHGQSRDVEVVETASESDPGDGFGHRKQTNRRCPNRRRSADRRKPVNMLHDETKHGLNIEPLALGDYFNDAIG